MKINKFKELFKSFEPFIFYNADLKRKNWFNIGGKAKVFFKAQELKYLIEFLKILNGQIKLNLLRLIIG